MLNAEHEAAEALRHVRLKAYSPQRLSRHSLRWLFELLGWRISNEKHAALRAGRN
jgi:hypothetical protein